MTQKWKRRLTGVLAAAMLMGLLPAFPGLIPEAKAADTKDAYGFDLKTPDDFNSGDKKNPFGSAAVYGHVNFNTVKELGIYESAANYQKNVVLNMDRNDKFSSVIPTNSTSNHYYRDKNQLVGALSGNNKTYFQRNDYSPLKFLNGVAFDPDGTGRDDHVVYYGFGNNLEGKVGDTKANVPGFIYFAASEGYTGNDTVKWSATPSGSPGAEYYYRWMNGLASFETDGYNAIVAGDFDGDGKDTIVVYDPAYGALALEEYNAPNFSFTRSKIEFGANTELAEYFNTYTLNQIQTAKGDAVHNNTAMVHLAAGDTDGDGKDELVATVSLGNLDGGLEGSIGSNSYDDDLKGSNASLVLVYDYDGGWKLVYHTQLANIYDESNKPSGKAGKYEGWFMRSAASAIGDIDGDGSPEIVTAGLVSDDIRHNDDDVGRDTMIFTVIDCGSKYEIRSLKNPLKDGNDATYNNHPDVIPEGWFIKNETKTNFKDWANAQTAYADNPPLSIGCVKLEGLEKPTYVFVRGHIFKFQSDSGRWKFVATQNPGDGDNNLDRYVEDVTYVSQPVIGNFDGNEQGREQVFFVVGTRGGTDTNWIAGLTFDPSNGKEVMNGSGLYSCCWDTNVMDRYAKYSASVVLTAPDVDKDDGLLAQYKRKEYTYSDPEIMAILEASPYFEDLVDEYPDTSGSTAFGIGKTSGTTTSESSSTRAGAYVSFSQGAGLFGIKVASAEMEASYEAEWSSEVAQSTEYSYEMSYETGRSFNQVLLIRTPVIVYTYDVTDPNGNTSEMHITTAEKPVYCLLPIEKYNEMARQLGHTEIGSDIIDVVPGQPNTYRKNTDDLKGKNPQTLNQWVDVGGGGNSVVTQSITKTTGQEITTSLTHSFDAKAGAGAFGFTVGVSGGYSQSKAQSVTNTESISRSGTVSSVPEDYSDDYGFSWQFMTWDAKIDGYTVPVLGYLVKDVKQPPSLPQNVDAVAETDSVTLTWEAGFNSAEKYEIARYLTDDESYNYVGTVMGTTANEDGKYVYEITGLTPGFSYSFSLRAVGDGRYSAYTTPLTVVTASKDGELPVIYVQPGDQDLRPGNDATFELTANSSGTGRLTFQWQMRKAGQIAWQNVHNANEDTLTIYAVSEDMDGYQYRCQVSQLNNSSISKVFIYSRAATLNVGKGGSTTTLKINTPGGTADYIEPELDEVTVTKIYQVTVGDTANSYYAYGTDPKYYYCLEDGKYYQLDNLQITTENETQGTATASADSRQELINLNGSLVQTVETETQLVASLSDLHSTIQETATFEGDDTTYNVFTAQGVAVERKADGTAVYELTESTLTLYQNADQSGDNPDATFYVEIGTYDAKNESLTIGLEAMKQASGGSLENLTYSGTPAPVWADTYTEEDGYTVLTDGESIICRKTESGKDAYFIRTETVDGESGTPSYTYPPLTLLRTTEEGPEDAIVTTTPLGIRTEDGKITGQIAHSSDALADTTIIPTTTDVPKSGDPVTLQAGVSTGTGKVIFKITNTTTGSVQNMEATLNGKFATVTWKPTAAGVYQIIATYQGDGDTLPSSSAPQMYYAYTDPNSLTGYRLVLPETSQYGEVVVPQLTAWESVDGIITETPASVSTQYTVHPFLGIGAEGADKDGYSEAADGNVNSLLPGDYIIKAAWGNGNTAAAKLTVTKRAVTVTAPTIGDLSPTAAQNFDLAAELKNIQVTDGSILSSDAEKYGGAEAGYPDLFQLTGGPKASGGIYDIHVDYIANYIANDDSALTEAQKKAKEIYTDFLDKYLPTFKKSVVFVRADTVNVYYGTDIENGYLTASANNTPFNSGDAIDVGSKLLFAAHPAETFKVSQWTINGDPIDKTPGATLVSDGEALIVNPVTANMNNMQVRVEFSNQLYRVSFSGDENGTVSAETNVGPISTNTNVVGGQTLTFTAKPNDGYVVKSWAVNNVEQKNSDGSLFSGKTLTLENLSADTTVQVVFEETADYTVTFTAVNDAGEPIETGVTLTAEGLDANKQAEKGSTVTLKATPSPGNAILAWDIRQADTGTWKNVAAAQQSYTIQNLQSDMQVRVRVNTNATSYAVNFAIYDVNDLETVIEDAGTLTATINDMPILTGELQPSSSQVKFTYTEPEDYEFVKWVVNGEDVETPTCTIDNLIADATVKAVVRKKPQVTIQTAENGTVTVQTEDGQTLTSGSYVYTGTTLTVTAKPNNGYVVGSLLGTDQDKSNGEKETTVSVDTNIDIAAVFLAKPTVTIQTVEGGNVVVTGTKDGASNVVLTDGSYVDFHTALTVTLRPDTGYQVAESINANYTDNDGKGTDDKHYPIEDVTEDQIITPAFDKIDTYVIIFDVHDTNGSEAGGKNGTLSASATRKGMEAYEQENFTSGTAVHKGSTVILTATPDEGYRVGSWKWINAEGEEEVVINNADGAGGSVYIGTQLQLATEDLSRENTITVEFVKIGAELYFEGVHGTVSAMLANTPLQDGVVVEKNALVNLTVEPDIGYEIQHWTVNGVEQPDSAKNSFDYKAPDSDENPGAVIKAVCQPVEYGVSWSAQGQGTVSAQGYTGSNAQIRGEQQVTFTAEPNPGYEVTFWTVNGQVQAAASGNTFQWKVPNGYLGEGAPTTAYVIQAHFTGASYTLTYAQPENGELNATVESGATVTGGQTVTFTASPDAGFEVAEWKVNDSTQVGNTSNSCTVTIQGDTTVEVVMASNTYTVTFSATEGGTVTSTSGLSPLTVSRHDSVTLTATPEQYYDLIHWVVNGDDQSYPATADRTLTLADITKDTEVQAVFQKQVSYNVKFSNGPGGTLTAQLEGQPFTPTLETGGAVPGGSTLEFTAAPEEGQMVSGWEVKVGANGTFVQVTKENMRELGITTMVHPLSQKMEIKVDHPLEIRVSFEAYEGFVIQADQKFCDVNIVERLPGDTEPNDDEIRKGGDVTFTLNLNGADGYAVWTKLVINGYDCIAGQLVEDKTKPDNCDTVSAVKNANGSYNVTILGVTGNIETTIEAHKLVVDKDMSNYQVPPSLVGVGLNELSEIQTQLDTMLTGSEDDTVYYDIALKYFNGDEWVEATGETFPEDGVDVVLEYPDGTDSRDKFTIVHMLTVAKDGKNPGDMETIAATNKSDGLHFHVGSLSPFAVSWVKYVPPVGGGTVGGYDITIEKSANGAVTADKETAEAGDTVTLIVKPDAGYAVEEITVTDKNGNAVEVANRGFRTYIFTMPASAVNVHATFAPKAPWVNPFVDVAEGAWYYDAVQFVNENGLMVGTSANTFSPEVTTTRGMIVTLLYRLEGTPDMENENWGYPYADVDADAYYGPAVYWARMNGIVDGYNDELFGPDDVITREQMATILYRYAQYKGYDISGKADLEGYTDADKISAWALDAVAWANKEELMSGTSSTTLEPMGSATRSQIATILTRFCLNIVK